MKVHIHQIPVEGILLEGEDPSTILELHEPDITPVSPVSYALDAGLSEGGFFATGRLAVDFEAICVSCLEKFIFPLRVDDFACQIELTGSEEIDLTEPIREDILLALPHHPRCDWNGKECPGVSRPAPAEPENGSGDRPNVWGSLDQLKLQ